MSPEFLLFRKSSSASDVWACGVLMWEVLSQGKAPYQNVQAKELVPFLESGQRLLQPQTCPNELWALILSCWAWELSERCDFATLQMKLQRQLDAQPASPAIRQRPHLF